MPLEHVALIVADYDQAIEFFTMTLGFELIADVPSLTSGGRPKRWVVVRPADGGAGVVLALADGPRQRDAVGHQFAGRVGLFLRVADFEATEKRLREAGCQVVRPARIEAYGRVLVFQDPWGNCWDLLG